MDYTPNSPSFSAHQSSSQQASGSGSGAGGISGSGGSKFDVIIWYPQYQSCLRYFLDVAQYSYPCQALAAFINIKLPFQRSSGSHSPGTASPVGRVPPTYRPGFNAPQSPSHPTLSAFGWVSLHPYIRRLVATGFDVPAILHGWFGDDWASGVGLLHEQERRNYLFAAKSGGWTLMKQNYDLVMDEAVPYLKPLERVDNIEIEAAEGSWSKWLAMEDWMLGARDPMAEEKAGAGGS